MEQSSEEVRGGIISPGAEMHCWAWDELEAGQVACLLVGKTFPIGGFVSEVRTKIDREMHAVHSKLSPVTGFGLH